MNASTAAATVSQKASESQSDTEDSSDITNHADDDLKPRDVERLLDVWLGPSIRRAASRRGGRTILGCLLARLGELGNHAERGFNMQTQYPQFEIVELAIMPADFARNRPQQQPRL
jgi:hypothetical protein